MTINKQQILRAEAKSKKPTCGIVMPISAIEDCPAEHWLEVKTILIDAISSAGYDANLVSDADDSGVIQRRIVQNLYDNEIVVCDVSCKNPNVMFELGMRLAFDKPTIIVMDDRSNYSFDTGIIEHLTYPRDLSYFKIVKFKETLIDKIKGTIENARRSDYTTFLKNFGQFTVAKIESKEGSIDEAILSRLDDLAKQVMWIKNNSQPEVIIGYNSKNRDLINQLVRQEIDKFCKETGTEESILCAKNENSQERKSLYSYVCANRDIRHLCGSPTNVREAIANNLIPF